jgi:hypothetical protein
MRIIEIIGLRLNSVKLTEDISNIILVSFHLFFAACTEHDSEY